MTRARPDASIVTVGTELTEGLRLDTNTQEVAGALVGAGYHVVEAVSIGDESAVLEATLARLCARDALVVVTGGLGPTHDDITRDAASRALGVALSRDASLVEALAPWAERHREEGAADRVMAQADLLEGAVLIRPTTGTAPGQIVRAPGGAMLVLLPGPPAEMRPMLAEALGVLSLHGGPTPVPPRELGCVGLSESDAQLRAQRALRGMTGVRLGLLAKPADVRVVLFDDGGGAETLERASNLVEAELGTHCYAADGSTLAEALLTAARRNGHTLATAESCTGGLVAAAITDVPGASDVFLGGIVAYSNDAKISLLGVSEHTLAEHGAVSAAVAEEMARGARTRLGADTAVAVTGIAGPGGGNASKPVGLVWFAVTSPDGSVRSEHRRLSGDRAGIRQRASVAALELLRNAVLGT